MLGAGLACLPVHGGRPPRTDSNASVGSLVAFPKPKQGNKRRGSILRAILRMKTAVFKFNTALFYEWMQSLSQNHNR